MRRRNTACNKAKAEQFKALSRVAKEAKQALEKLNNALAKEDTPQQGGASATTAQGVRSHEQQAAAEQQRMSRVAQAMAARSLQLEALADQLQDQHSQLQDAAEVSTKSLAALKRKATAVVRCAQV